MTSIQHFEQSPLHHEDTNVRHAHLGNVQLHGSAILHNSDVCRPYTTCGRYESAMLLEPNAVSAKSSQGLSSANDVKQDDHNGDHQQEVNEPSHRVTGQQSQYPQNQQYYCNCPQHMILLSVCAGFTTDRQALQRDWMFTTDMFNVVIFWSCLCLLTAVDLVLS